VARVLANLCMAILMTTFFFDLRIASRMLKRAPAFAIGSIVTLGLAIGATTAIFSVIEPVLLQRLPYPDPQRLMFVWERDPDGTRDNVGFATFRDLASQAKTLEAASAVANWRPTLSGGQADAERVDGQSVSWTYWRVLGVRPELGRAFTADEDRPGQNQAVILSHGLWQRRYGSDPAIIGKAVSISGNPMTVVGVMPASFDNVIAPTAEIWRPLGYDNQPWACRTCHHLSMLIRVRSGVAAGAVRSDLDRIHHQLEAMFPKEYASIGTLVVPLQSDITRLYRPALLTLFTGMLLVLLIAAANIANLQLARAIQRREEFSVRAALGAGRSQILRQLLAEGFLLALLGGVTGIVVAVVSIPLLVSHLPDQLPRLSAIHLDPAALGAVVTLVLFLAVVIGLVPAQHRRDDIGVDLRSGTRVSTGTHGVRSGLVVAEVSLALVLLASAGLVGKSMVRLLSVNVGFDPTHLLSLEINSVGPRYADNASVYAYHRRVREAVAALPGIVSVAAASQLPLGGNFDEYGVSDPANVPANPAAAPSGDRYVVSPDYVTTMRIPVIRGRMFTPAEAADTGVKIALVSAALAGRIWPGQDPIGKRVQFGGPGHAPYRVIGVVGNVKHEGLDAKTALQWYVPEGQWHGGADGQEVIVMRTRGDPAAIARRVQQTVSAIDPTQAVAHIATMDQLIAVSTSQRRLALVLLTAFATGALGLAVAGIYAVVAGSVADRTPEIAVRSVLGATPRDIAALVLGQGARLTGVGIVLGLCGTAGLSRFLGGLLFGVGPTDPATFVVVATLLSAVTLAACAIPALRAAAIDPSSALHGGLSHS
jgi:putative ABC transport system permease protein